MPCVATGSTGCRPAQTFVGRGRNVFPRDDEFVRRNPVAFDHDLLCFLRDGLGTVVAIGGFVRAGMAGWERAVLDKPAALEMSGGNHGKKSNAFLHRAAQPGEIPRDWRGRGDAGGLITAEGAGAGEI